MSFFLFGDEVYRGYLPIWRKFFEEHPFWQEKRKFSRAEAWIDILKNTHFKDEPTQRLIRGRLITIEYGECVMTTRYCGQAWRWSQSSVLRFLKLLELMEQITLKTVQQMTKITVLNYYKYDIRQNNNESVANQWRFSDGSVTVQTKEHKNVKSVKNKEIKTSSNGFDEFWKNYPRKVGKKDAIKSWNKIKPSQELVEKMLSTINIQIQSEQWNKNNGQYIPYPTTWLNQGRWDDEPIIEDNRFSDITKQNIKTLNEWSPPDER